MAAATRPWLRGGHLQGGQLPTARPSAPPRSGRQREPRRERQLPPVFHVCPARRRRSQTALTDDARRASQPSPRSVG
jgi:hypothetical protein